MGLGVLKSYDPWGPMVPHMGPQGPRGKKNWVPPALDPIIFPRGPLGPKSADPFGAFGVLEQLLVSPSLTLPRGTRNPKNWYLRGGVQNSTAPRANTGRSRIICRKLPAPYIFDTDTSRSLQDAPRCPKPPPGRPQEPPKTGKWSLGAPKNH